MAQEILVDLAILNIIRGTMYVCILTDPWKEKFLIKLSSCISSGLS